MSETAVSSASSTQQPSGAKLDTFVPVEGGKESVSAELMLVLAYLVMWALVLAFVLQTFRRTVGLSSRVQRLEALLERAEAALDVQTAVDRPASEAAAPSEPAAP